MANENFEKAFLKAQQAMTKAKKDAQNPFFKSTYADYESVADAVKAPLNDNGISYRHTSRWVDNILFVGTVLTHAESGEKSDPFELPTRTSGTPQEMGSAITYNRRYSLAAACGIPQEDDDANAASSKPKAEASTSKSVLSQLLKQGAPNQERQIAPKDPSSLASEKQINLIEGRARKAGWTFNELDEYCNIRFGVEGYKKISKGSVNALLDDLAIPQPARSIIDGYLLSTLGDQPAPGLNEIPF